MLQSKLLSKNSSLIHGFTTREEGNLNISPKNESQLRKFIEKIGLNYKNVVFFEQVHGTKIASIVDTDRGKLIKGCDGGLTNKPKLILTVKTADCLPVLLFDPYVQLVSAIHAGWKGIVKGIITQAVKKMIFLGSKPKNILMSVGPHIGGCCYRVLPDRARKFREIFGKDERMVYKEKDQLHLDLAQAAFIAAGKTGLIKEHIDILLSCTSCHNNRFFSYRREGENLEGQMLGFITMKK